MRKVASIFFLTLFLLYHVGYLGFYWFSLKKIDYKYQTLVNFEGPVKRISIPITLPYWNDQSEYRTAQGKINLDGKIYRKVLQKYAQDAVHLVLVEDKLTEKLNTSLADWLDTMNGTSNEKSLLKSVVKDFLPTEDPYDYGSPFSLVDQRYFSYNYYLLERSSDVITPPPQV